MTLLEADEPPAYEVVNGEGASRLFILCDHASNRLPRALGDLGLDAPLLVDHIAWDIGAADLGRTISAALDAPLVLSGYSRLAIDCNRPLGVSSSIPAVTCDVPVPGNASLSETERSARVAELFSPYHEAIERTLAERGRRGIASVILSLHSFTPSLYGRERPWHLGVMYGRDRRFAAALLAALEARPGWTIGDNEPYRVSEGSDYGIPVHAERAGRPGVLLEVRQDLLADPSGVTRLSALLIPALREVLASVDTW